MDHLIFYCDFTHKDNLQRSVHIDTISEFSFPFFAVVITSELEISLLVLPFPYVPELLTLFNSYIQQGLEVELVCRCLFFLLK